MITFVKTKLIAMGFDVESEEREYYSQMEKSCLEALFRVEDAIVLCNLYGKGDAIFAKENMKRIHSKIEEILKECQKNLGKAVKDYSIHEPSQSLFGDNLEEYIDNLLVQYNCDEDMDLFEEDDTPEDHFVKVLAMVTCEASSQLWECTDMRYDNDNLQMIAYSLSDIQEFLSGCNVLSSDFEKSFADVCEFNRSCRR